MDTAVPRRGNRFEWAFIVVTSILLGVVTVRLASMETRWIVFGAAGALVVVTAAVLGFERTMVAIFVVGLSVDAHYYLTTPPPVLLWTGTTTPGALSIPLALVPGLLVLGRRILVNRATGTRLDWGGDIGIRFGWFLAFSVVANVASIFRFPGLCLIWQGAALFALFVITLNAVRSRRDASFAVDLLMVALLGQCLVFVLQIGTGISFSAVGGIRRIASEGTTVWHSASGTAASTTAGFAMFLDPLVILAYTLFRASPPSVRRRLYGGLFLFGATVLTLTLNRSTWLGMPLGIGLVEWLLRRRGLVSVGTGRRGLTVAPVLVLVIFVLAAPMFQSVRKVHHEDDLQQRIDLMKPAVAMIARHPILGVGPGAYGFVLRDYSDRSYKGWLYIAHNDYLLIWAERGTVAFIAWLLFLRSVGRELSKTTRRAQAWDAAVGIGALSGFVMQLWEVFWTAGMGFSPYGVMFVIIGICAGLNRRVPLVVPQGDKPTVTAAQSGTATRDAVGMPAA